MDKLEKCASGWSKEEMDAFNVVMGNPTMPHYKSPDYDDWLWHKAWQAALAAAPTPPAQEAEPVKPVGRKSQYADQRQPDRWYDCPYDDLKYYAEMGDKTRVLYMYVDQPTLYTTAPSDKLRQAAEEAEVALSAFCDGDDWMGTVPGDALKNLRAALEKKS